MPEETFQITWIILNAVRNLQTGVDKLALFLKGSKSKLVVPIESKQLFGGLMWHDIPTIKGFINQLIDMEFIRKKNIQGYTYFYPVLELTEAGKKVLDEKMKVELQIIKEQKPVKVGESEMTTFELFSEGKNIEEIAKERNLAVSSIYDHMHHLVVNGYLSSKEFISEDKINQILEAKKKFPNAAKLKELKQALPESVSYNEIKCVLADKTLEAKNAQ